jgi:putative effector of murein hydrolase
MTPQLNAIWVYLAASPLLGLTATLLAYQLAFALYTRSGFNPLVNPVAIAVAVLVLILTVTGTPYQTYFDGAKFVHFLLGPATVALAIPLYQQVEKLRRNWVAFLVPRRPPSCRWRPSPSPRRSPWGFQKKSVACHR